MKCVIPGVNIKVFGRAVHSLAKIGEELYVEPGPSEVAFRTVNSSRSAFASFVFGSAFFSQYDGGAEAAGEDDAVKCKVAMKACVNVFKSLAGLERSVERCKLTLDGEESRLAIQLNCRYGLVKTYNLAFIECETLQAVYDKSTCLNFINSQARVLSDAVVNFQPNQDEVSLCSCPEKTVIRNYVDDEPDPSKAIHTVLTLEALEFDSYSIPEEVEVTFCLKELRAMLAFAEPVNLPVSLHFSTPGSPMIVVVDNKPMVEATFVLATLADKTESQLSRTMKKAKHAHSTTHTPARHAHSNAHTPTRPTPSHDVSQERLREDNCSRDSEQITNMTSGLFDKRGSISSVHNSTLLRPEKTVLAASPLCNGNTTLPTSQRMNTPQRMSQQTLSPPSYNTNGRVGLTDINQREISNQNGEVAGRRQDMSVMGEYDEVPATPPPKRPKTSYLFQKCFESTFDPTSIPGFDVVLAPDSDEDN